MNRAVLLGIFAIVAIAQLAVPAQMIWSRETIMDGGALYKFLAQPIDPYDPFQGRYVSLSVGQMRAPLPEGWYPVYGEPVYATLGTDEEGYARVDAVTKTRPDSGDFIRATVQWVDDQGQELSLDLPIDRYYMNEWAAPQAERAYRDNQWQEETDVYVTVRVLAGEIVIEGLFIDDVPIEEYVKTMATTDGGNP